jgi:hypothetical protein
MLSIEQLRKNDPQLATLADEEVVKIRDSFYELGVLIFDDWLETDGGSKFPTGVLLETEKDNKVKQWNRKERKQA